MAETFTFELVSPDKLLFSKKVAMVTVPGEFGEYGVLAGHAPMITTIKPGVIRVYEDDDATVSQKLFVGEGFAEVMQSRFTVLAGEALPISDLDEASLQKQAKDLATKIMTTEDEDARLALEAEQSVVRAKLYAIAA